MLFDLQGHRRVLTEGGDFFSPALAWSPDGSEIWFSAEKRSDQTRYGSWRPALRAVSLSGRERILLRMPQFQSLQDVAADGRVLLTTGQLRGETFAKPPGEQAERNLSWHEGSSYAELSRDGRQLLFLEQAESATYLRPTDGGPARRLCSGQAIGLSPDARLVVRHGALDRPPHAHPHPGRRADRGARPPNRPLGLPLVRRRPAVARHRQRGGTSNLRAWVVDTRDGSRHAVTPEGIGCWLVSPDGRTAACARPGGDSYLYPVDGEGDPRPTPGFVPGDHMRQWSADGRFLYVSEAYARPARLFRLDLQTGERRLWREFVTNPAGIVGTVDPAITPDGSAWAYAVLRHINDLILVEGIQ